MAKTKVLIIGIEPSLIDFTDGLYALAGSAAAVLAGLETDEAHLNGLGYAAELCLVDFGATAPTVLRDRLRQTVFDCIVIGAGIRMIPRNTFLFETLVNTVRSEAPQATLCFSTRPTDTAEAVQRWVLPAKPA
ncbi:MAG TPA: hypothetical protein VE397_08970 [Stellaceae bacterium]|jgi:hypothetical protein|nr:hypothetical protein [Stellaceae bacterium]